MPQLSGEIFHKVINFKVCFCSTFSDMNPVFQLDFFYKFSELGKTFKSYCDYVHGVSNDIINKRRELLVSAIKSKFWNSVSH